ncbi:bestrophin family protein [Tsuneonella sp. HG222]
MIVRDVPGKMELLFAVRGSIVPVIAPRVAFLMAVSAAMVALHRYFGLFPEVDAFGFTTFGIALSLFLGFRNNAAYDRWWEARKLWGGLLADVRSLAREAEVFVRDRDLKHALLEVALAFLHLHRQNLRGIPADLEDRTSKDALVNAPHPPCAALDRMAEIILSGCADQTIDGFGARALSERLASMSQQQAGCERIATTPLPYVYSLLIYRTTYLYCLLLPLALVGPAGWMTPVFVGIVAYMFLGLAEVSEELSHPFGITPNALPLDAICRTAEISLAPHLGKPAPELLTAKNFFLS